MTNISVVVPAYNEAGNIAALVLEITDTATGCEIVVVDDASTDATASVLLPMQERVPRLKVVRHARRYGQSAALRTGIAHAAGEIIVTMDGDGQNDPADVPALVRTLLSNDAGIVMVAGHRKNRQDTPWRVFCSRVANAVRRGFLGDATPDTGCGLKVFYRSAYAALPFFDHMHRFLPALVRMQGGVVVSQEVRHRPRLHGVSKYGTWDRLRAGIVDIAGVCWLRRRWKRIEIARCD